ncbi:MAG: hypothetical protein GWO22_25700, partial [Actinobacteria bacterium]|nr:hypothetical protein [Actinomycetota bacterium]
MALPTVDRDEWWQLTEPLDPAALSESTWHGPGRAEALEAAEASLIAAIGDPSVVERLGPASAMLDGVAPETMMPTRWREEVGAVLVEAIERGSETPASLLALGRIRMR